MMPMRKRAAIALCFILPGLMAGCAIPFGKSPADPFRDVTDGPKAVLHVGLSTQAEIYRDLGPPAFHSQTGDIWRYNKLAYAGFYVFFPPLVLVHAQGLVGPFATIWEDFSLFLWFDEAGALQKAQSSRLFDRSAPDSSLFESTSRSPLQVRGNKVLPTTRDNPHSSTEK
jgi:hypothetical protein